MKDTYIKLAIGILLFATWLGIVLAGVHGAEDIITAIKAALFGLGVYHLGDRSPESPTVANREGGFVRPGLLILLALSGMLMLAGCAAPVPNASPVQMEQVTYTQACAAYGAAFGSALELRRAGRLNRSQIDQVTLLDSQITPICTGPLPADPATASQQITAAVTAMAILEAVHQEQ